MTEPERAPYRTVATIRTDFPSKFGVPRQAGLVPELLARVVFEHDFRNPDAVRGLDGFSHLWLVWEFSLSLRADWSPTVRPPRLRGERVGVFATRSPFRPNPIGLSSVRLERIDMDEDLGPVLVVSGADLVDGTPILDIKPYVPYADIIPKASNSIASAAPQLIDVQWTTAALHQAHGHAQRLGEPLVELIEQCLAQDPRPAYQTPAPEREYGAQFWDLDVRWHYPTPEQICVLEVIPANT